MCYIWLILCDSLDCWEQHIFESMHIILFNYLSLAFVVSFSRLLCDRAHAHAHKHIPSYGAVSLRDLLDGYAAACCCRCCRASWCMPASSSSNVMHTRSGTRAPARLRVLLIHNLCNALTPNKLPANVNDASARARTTAKCMCRSAADICYMLTHAQRATESHIHPTQIYTNSENKPFVSIVRRGRVLWLWWTCCDTRARAHSFRCLCFDSLALLMLLCG